MPGIPTNQFKCIAGNSACLVAMAPSGTGNGKIMRSTDGITWAAQTNPAGGYNAVCWSSALSLFIAVGNSGNVATSPDAITWTTRTAASASGWIGVVANGSIVVAVATGGQVMTSTDGITWTTRTASASLAWNGVAWNGAQFAAVASSGTGSRSMLSPDGITWTADTTPADNDWQAVCASSGGKLVAVGRTGTGNRVMTRG